MGSVIASDSLASALGPIVLSNVRTGLDADAIAAALIDNLHCIQAKLPQSPPGRGGGAVSTPRSRRQMISPRGTAPLS